MVVTRRRLHRRETLSDSGVDRRRRRLTSHIYIIASNFNNDYTSKLWRNKSFLRIYITCRSPFSFPYPRSSFQRKSRLQIVNIYIKRLIFLPPTIQFVNI